MKPFLILLFAVIALVSIAQEGSKNPEVNRCRESLRYYRYSKYLDSALYFLKRVMKLH